MYCKKCGKEIKEGNTFCTNCGEPINNIKENTTRTETNTNTDEKENNKSNKKVIKLKLWHIITITLICLALLIGVVVIFNNKNNSDKLQNVNNIVAQDTSKSSDKKYDVEIGKYYKYSLDNQYSTIVFNNSTGFILKSGVVNSEEIVETGTYQIEDNKISFTINYNSIYGDGEGISDEDVKIPYTKEMTILENGNIEYVTPYTTCLYIKEGSNIGYTVDETNTSDNLLETIYSKYPEMKEKEGFICTNGEEYWLLDKAGNQLYFYDLNSFESALGKVNTYEGSSKLTKVNKIDRQVFLSNLTNEHKMIIKQNALKNEKNLNEQNFVEDKFEIVDNNIIYSYIFIFTDSLGRINADLRAYTYVITPAKEIPSELDEIRYNFDSYFVIKNATNYRANDIACDNVTLSKSSGITKEEVIENLPKLYNRIDERIDSMKEYSLSDDNCKLIAYNYMKYIESSYLPFKHDHMQIQSVMKDYFNVANRNKIIYITRYGKRINASNAYEKNIEEFVAIGVCIELSDLPLTFMNFSIDELIKTGYLSNDIDKTVVVTPIKQIYPSEADVQDYQNFKNETDNYILQKFGL